MEAKDPVLMMHHDDTIKWTDDGVKYCAHIQREDYPSDPRIDRDHFATMVCFGRNRLGDKHDFENPEDFWQKLVGNHVSYEDIFTAARDGKIEGIRLEKCEDDPGCWNVYERGVFSTILGSTGEDERLEYSCLSDQQVPYHIIDDLTVGNCMELVKPYVAWLPLWVYEHSGITMSAGKRNPYSCRWDSGCAGWIYMTKKQVMENICEYVLDEHGERVKIVHDHPDGRQTFCYQTKKPTEETWEEIAHDYMEDEVKEYDLYLTGEVYGFTLYEEQDGEWTEAESCWGFFGDDICESGLADEVGCGLREAIERGEYETGEAEVVTISYLKL